MNELNKKVLGFALAFVFLAILATPFALAKSTDYPKNNEKFQSFEVNLIATLPTDSQTTFKPNMINPNIMVQTFGNNLVYNEIVIGETRSYLMDTHFDYSQSCKLTTIIASAKSVYHFVIRYEYDFIEATSGIDGTLEMLFVDSTIRSLRGTGDLQNVQIIATAPEMGSHVGVVLGWPDIPIPTP